MGKRHATRAEVRAQKRAADNCGGAREFARRVSVSRQTIYDWRKTGVPAAWLPKVVKVSGVPAADLRPDIARVIRG
jgi:predicted DNA-binding transcriptional regulator AlpA